MLQNDVFYNRQRSGYDELVSYQPKYYQNIQEMQAINQFGGLTTDKMASDLEQLVLDQFIDSCSVEMLNRFEQFLHITGYETRSITERRSIVKVNWIGNIKMNRTQIKALIRAYCGCDSEVHFTHEVMIIAKISGSKSTIYVGDLLSIFNSQIPAHLKWTAVLETESNSIKAGRSICYWRYDYAKCGTSPDVSRLGEAIDTDIQVAADTRGYLYDHEQTGNVVAGTNPRIGTVGEQIKVTVRSNAISKEYLSEYNLSGETVSGTTPESANVGVVEKTTVRVYAHSDSYKYDIPQSGSKNEREEED